MANTYDKNENILTLKRYGSRADGLVLFDQLSYQYSGNRLNKVIDAITGLNSLGDFRNTTPPTSLNEFDANGNLVFDVDRNMQLHYSTRNLPLDIVFDEGLIRNTYRPDGLKTSKMVYDGKGRLTTNETYLGNLVLNFGVPSQILHPEGVVDVSNLSQPVVHYHLKDHLGNVRAVVNPSATNTALISQTNDYYPFGMCYTKMPGPFVNKRKYNGKEEQEMPGRWLDYGARFYDPQLGRWHGVDKLAEHPNQISQTPYQYAWNTPVNLNDPDGNCPWCIIGAVVGAAVDYGSQVAVNYATGKESPWTNVNGASIVTSAIAGATTGGLASVARTGAITTTRAVAGSMAVNAGESISKQMVTEGTVNPTQVVIDVAAGQIADGIPTKNLVPTKQLERRLDRAIRVAGETPRASRAEAVNTAQGKVNAANNVNQANSATQAKVAENVIGATGGAATSSSSSNNTPAPVLAPVVAPVDNTRVKLPIIPGLR